MTFGPPPLTGAVGAFLLAFPALFSIVNPIGAALIFNEVTEGRTASERKALAVRIAGYSLLILLGSLWLGAYILNFFGVSISALRIAGGAVVAFRAWGLLMNPEVSETRKATDAAPAEDADDVAFFPLTMPFTTGPGTISVAIALSSQRPERSERLIPFFAGVSLAALCVAATVWLSYSSSDTVMRLLGPSGARVVSRLVAFLLLCVGVQIMLTGLEGLFVTPRP
jgi:multiple antibiotic resistance protein